MSEKQKRQAFVFRLQLDVEVSVEADDGDEASDALGIYLRNEGLTNDMIDVELMKVMDPAELERQDGEIHLKSGELP